MKTTIRAAAAVVTLFAASAAQAQTQQAVQWKVSDGGNGHWYGRLEGSFPFSHAALNSAAAAAGASLVSLQSSAEEQFVVATIGPGLIGLQSAAGESAFHWSSGEAVTYTNWGLPACASGPYPNNPASQARFVFQSHPECSGAAGLVHAWDDYWAIELGNSIIDPNIEWSADCNNDGIVDYGQCRNGTLPDYNGNNVPDCCEQSVPCLYKPIQWSSGVGGNGHWYQLQIAQSGISWTAAQSAAVASGGHLATLTSMAENSFVFVLSNVTQAYGGSSVVGPWLGGRRDGDSWSWVTGEAWNFVNWLPPNPDGPGTWGENCVCFTASAGRWNDFNEAGWQPGIAMQAYVVEWSADCNNDGIVDYGQILDGTIPDANGNGVPDCCDGGGSCTPCPGDVASDGMVDGVDLAAVLSQWGTQGSGTFNADIDGSGLVDGGDLALVLGGWGPCPQ